MLEERARANGLTLSEWVRDVLLAAPAEPGAEAGSEVVLAEVLALRPLFLNLQFQADKGSFSETEQLRDRSGLYCECAHIGHKDLRMAARYQHLSRAFLSNAVKLLDGAYADKPKDAANEKPKPSETRSVHALSLPPRYRPDEPKRLSGS